MVVHCLLQLFELFPNIGDALSGHSVITLHHLACYQYLDMDRQLGIQLGEGGFKEILVIFLDVFCPLLLQDLVFGGPFSCKKRENVISHNHGICIKHGMMSVINRQ